MSPRPTGLSLQESLENLFYEGKQMTVGIMPTGAPLTLPVFDPFKSLDWSAIRLFRPGSKDCKCVLQRLCEKNATER